MAVATELGKLEAVEKKVKFLAADNIVTLTRVALGIVFFWFGVLKLFPGASSAEAIAGETITKLTFGLIHPSVSMPLLGVWECTIGLGLLSGKFLRATMVLMFAQMPGTFLPFLFFPKLCWEHFPYSPSLLGQYIVKNLVLLCAGVLVIATMHGGKVITDPVVASRASRMQGVFARFRRRFGKEPPEERKHELR